MAMMPDIGSSALKHGYTEQDIHFAFDHVHIERSEREAETNHGKGNPID